MPEMTAWAAPLCIDAAAEAVSPVRSLLLQCRCSHHAMSRRRRKQSCATAFVPQQPPATSVFWKGQLHRAARTTSVPGHLPVQPLLFSADALQRAQGSVPAAGAAAAAPRCGGERPRRRPALRQGRGLPAAGARVAPVVVASGARPDHEIDRTPFTLKPKTYPSENMLAPGPRASSYVLCTQ